VQLIKQKHNLLDLVIPSKRIKNPVILLKSNQTNRVILSKTAITSDTTIAKEGTNNSDIYLFFVAYFLY